MPQRLEFLRSLFDHNGGICKRLGSSQTDALVTVALNDLQMTISRELRKKQSASRPSQG